MALNPSQSLSAQTWVDIISSVRITSYSNAAGLTLIIFDYLLTFQDEVKYMWKRTWSILKALYLITRYLPFFDIPLTLVIHDIHFEPRLSLGECKSLWNIQAWSFVVGLVVANGILFIRTLAVWDQSKTLFASLLSLLLATMGVALYYAQQFISEGEAIYNPFYSQEFTSCFVALSRNDLFICYSVLLAYETVVVLLLIAKGIYSRAFEPAPFYLAIYRDSIVFYFFLFLASVANILLLFSTRGLSTIYMTSIHRALHAVLAERLILNIRGAASPPDYWDSVYVI